MSKKQSEKPESRPAPKPVKPQRPQNTVERGINSANDVKKKGK